MGEENELTRIYHIQYVRNSRAITVVWAIFTICFAILNIVAFIQPQWLGYTEKSLNAGYFGLYEVCTILTGGELSCDGDFLDFTTILNDSFRAASMLVGISALLFLLAIICLLLFFFLRASTVLKVCGWLQLLAGICMGIACIVYPSGWDDVKVQAVCGQQAGKYQLGWCEMRWAFILSIVLIFDAFILAILAFFLAAKQADLLPKQQKEKQKSMYITVCILLYKTVKLDLRNIHNILTAILRQGAE
ncbi:LHFPL [Mytilus coruscus]|uniref:LHFPL n=1 Tax=Mytilus coruscus TaxID=42192 RepID=A0A6J8B759_MYTCO|nr:LHFPL [Mytilus coruscus]